MYRDSSKIPPFKNGELQVPRWGKRELYTRTGRHQSDRGAHVVRLPKPLVLAGQPPPGLPSRLCLAVDPAPSSKVWHAPRTGHGRCAS